MKPIYRILLGVAVGAGLGLGYHFLVGCGTGTCPISGNVWISTLYGSLLGLVLVSPSRCNRGSCAVRAKSENPENFS